MMQEQEMLPGVKRIENDDDTRSNKKRPGGAPIKGDEPKKSETISRPQAENIKEIKIDKELFPPFNKKMLGEIIEKYAPEREERGRRDGSTANGLPVSFIDCVILEYNTQNKEKLNVNDPVSFKVVISVLEEKNIKYNKKKVVDEIKFLEKHLAD